MPPPFLLVGNKCDLVTEREVTEREGRRMARRFGCEFMETSARTMVNVERSFASVVRGIRQREIDLQLEMSRVRRSMSRPKRRGLLMKWL